MGSRQPDVPRAEPTVVGVATGYEVDRPIASFQGRLGTPALHRAALDENGERGAVDTVARFERAIEGLDAGMREKLTARPPTELFSTAADVGPLEPLVDQLRGDQVFLTELEELTARMAPVFDLRVFDATMEGVFQGLLVCSPESHALFRAVLQRLIPRTRPWRAGWAAPKLLIPLLEGAYQGKVDGWPRDRFRRHIQHTDSSEIPFSDLLRLLGLVESKGVIRPRARLSPTSRRASANRGPS